MDTFSFWFPNISEATMEKSKSDSIYVRGRCRRETICIGKTVYNAFTTYSERLAEKI